jgi:Ca-activated chloride channel family protein
MLDRIKNINWEDFHFLRTDYVWEGVAVLVLISFGLLFYKEPNAWKKHIAKHLQPYVIQKGTTWKSSLIRLSVIIMFSIGFIAYLGPTWNKVDGPTKKIESQFIIALDMSKSMLTKDVSPTRLERAKFKIHDLLMANPRAETNLIVFSGSSHVAIPFTTDYKIILDQLDGLLPKMMPIPGTAFSGLFNKIDSLFKDNKAQGKILLITDDLEDLSIERVSVFLQQNNVKLYIYPFATQSGGTVPSFKKNSALDVDKLNSLGQMDAVDILEVTLDDSDVKDLAKTISDALVFEDKPDEKDENWEDNGYWLLFPLAFLLLFSFRKGWTLNLIIILISFSSCSDDKNKKSSDLKFKDLWYTQAYQAQQEYDKENYLTAAVKFEDPMHKGIAYYKAGDYLSAQSAFEQDTTVSGLYNLGLTYAKLGQLNKSQEIFENVLQRDPSNENAVSNLQQITRAIDEISTLKPENAALEDDKPIAQNKQNDSPEDLSGGGQEATKKDMEKERKEETTETGERKGKELDELPDDFKAGKGQLPKNVLMRKADDDPSLFLTKKFRYQVKKGLVEIEKTDKKW